MKKQEILKSTKNSKSYYMHERRQLEKKTYYMITFIGNSTITESRLVVDWGWEKC